MRYLPNVLMFTAAVAVAAVVSAGVGFLFVPVKTVERGPTVEEQQQFVDRNRQLEIRLKFESRLRQATSATIISGSHPPLVVNDPAELQKLQLALRIKSTSSGVEGADDAPTVRFHLANGTLFECDFYTPTTLGSSDGQAILEDTAFLDLVNELVSKKEGRKIDVLKRN
jgi:hypothetical protein